MRSWMVGRRGRWTALGIAAVMLSAAGCASSDSEGDTSNEVESPDGEATTDVTGSEPETTEAEAADEEPVSVAMAVQQSSLNTAVHAVAIDQGLYEKHGVDVEVTTFPSGQGPSGAEQLLQGGAQIAIASSLEFMRANSASMESGEGAPLAVVALALPCPTNLVLGEGVEYDGPESLDGLVVGASSFTSTHLQLIHAYFDDEYGLTPDDLGWELIEMSSGNMPPALASGQIDGFLHSEPTASIAIRESGGHIGLTCAEGDFGRVSDVATLAIATSHDWMDENPDAVESVVAALREATEALDTLPRQELTEIYVDWTGAEPELVELGLDRIRPGLTEPETWEVLWEILGGELKSAGQIVEDMAPSDVFDFSVSYPDKSLELEE